MKNNVKILGGQPVLANSETGLLPYQPNKSLNPKNLKRERICLRCYTNLAKRHKCENCGLRFHDGPLLSLLKKLLGISPR
ncbi:MAG: hypothetical protein K1X72_19960 [Pyrinomonadaceae bacterium]|nr:hypothetical protein [Pyrinomonadaceae bacterium]